MRESIFVSERNYNEKTEFLIYSLQKIDGSRVVVLQFTDEKSEKFILTDLIIKSRGYCSGPIIAMPPLEFNLSPSLSTAEAILKFFNEQCVFYSVDVISKNHLNAVLSILDGFKKIKFSNSISGFDSLSASLKGLTGVEINPTEFPLKGPCSEGESYKCCVMW